MGLVNIILHGLNITMTIFLSFVLNYKKAFTNVIHFSRKKKFA